MGMVPSKTSREQRHGESSSGGNKRTLVSEAPQSRTFVSEAPQSRVHFLVFNIS